MNQNTLFHTASSAVTAGLASVLVMDDASAFLPLPLIGEVPAWAGIAGISGAVQLLDDMLVRPNLRMLPNAVQPYLNSADTLGYLVTLGAGSGAVAYASGLDAVASAQVAGLVVVADMASNWLVDRWVKPSGSIKI